MSGAAYPARGLSASRSTHPPVGPRVAGPGGALAVAAMCLLGMALVWALSALVPTVQLHDARLLSDFVSLGRPRVDRVSALLLRLLNPVLFVIWGLGLVFVALARDRPRVALAVVAVMSLAPLTSEELKPLLAHGHDSVSGIVVGPASWPSGHSTAALALVLCAVLVTPTRLRTLAAALGAVFALAVGCALLILHWHMPSDVLGGYLVASLWTALAVAVLRAAELRWPSGRVRAVRPGVPQGLR